MSEPGGSSTGDAWGGQALNAPRCRQRPFAEQLRQKRRPLEPERQFCRQPFRGEEAEPHLRMSPTEKTARVVRERSGRGGILPSTSDEARQILEEALRLPLDERTSERRSGADRQPRWRARRRRKGFRFSGLLADQLPGLLFGCTWPRNGHGSTCGCEDLLQPTRQLERRETLTRVEVVLARFRRRRGGAHCAQPRRR